MQRHLNLVQSDFEHLEKRVLPRFPFCFMSFKLDEEDVRVYEVKDISHSGMQLCLKAGDHSVKSEDKIKGQLHWGKNRLEVLGTVKWLRGMRVGVEFLTAIKNQQQMADFLSLKNMASMLKPVHQIDCGVELPVKLKYWLRADGPVEIFVWRHNDGEIARFQFIMMENFIEWEDGPGIKTGRVISKRNIETPLLNEDEFVFKIDQGLDETKLKMAHGLISHIDAQLMAQEIITFIKLKLA